MPEKPAAATLRNTMLHRERANRPSSSKDARSIRTDRALADAFLALLEHKKLEQITVREICARAGIHYVTFFRRYETKEELLHAVAASQVDRVIELTMPILDDGDGAGGFASLFTYIDEHRVVWSALLGGGAAATIRKSMLETAENLSRTHNQEGGFLPTGLARVCTVSSIAECIAWWLGEDGANVSALEMAAMANMVVAACLPHNTLFRSSKSLGA